MIKVKVNNKENFMSLVKKHKNSDATNDHVAAQFEFLIPFCWPSRKILCGTDLNFTKMRCLISLTCILSSCYSYKIFPKEARSFVYSGEKQNAFIP
ncbi:MAG: hypothetical protein C5B59_14245 [Bacteroidetes bacterium]|nr:MAG: hypothetical protein C5B59_14245 [Bacteroidota bacterium]